MKPEQHSPKRDSAGGGWLRLPFAALLICCGVLAYRPAMNRFFSGDQIAYFAELDGERSLAPGLDLLDYGAARFFDRGDEVLYRPLLFAWLATENASFGLDFRAWNAANLALHLLLAYLLFEVLWRMHRTALAYAVALLFALLVSNFEQVSWNHLGGYMLGYGLLLAALAAAREMVRAGDGAAASSRWSWIYALAMTGAMWSHEIAVLASFGVAAYGIVCRWRKPGTPWRRWAAAWGAPILAYGVSYALHWARCGRLLWVHAPTETASANGAWLASVFPLIGQWTARILFPGRGLLAVQPLLRSGWVSTTEGWTLGDVGMAALWVGLLVCLHRGFTRRGLKEAWPFAALLGGMILAYAAMNLAGRPYAEKVAYYPYFLALFGATGLYSLVDFQRVGRGGRAGAMAILLLLAMGHGGLTYQTSGRVREANVSIARYYDWIEQSVQPRFSDPDFTFAIEGAPPDLDPRHPLPLGYPDWGIAVIEPVSKWLYGRRYDAVAPAETLVFPGMEALPR